MLQRDKNLNYLARSLALQIQWAVNKVTREFCFEHQINSTSAPLCINALNN
jgi:hypothetical protein